MILVIIVIKCSCNATIIGSGFALHLLAAVFLLLFTPNRIKTKHFIYVKIPIQPLVMEVDYMRYILFTKRIISALRFMIVLLNLRPRIMYTLILLQTIRHRRVS